MKKIIFVLIAGILLISCSKDAPTKTEVKKGILWGKVSITVPQIFEDGRKGKDLTYSEELDSLKVLSIGIGLDSNITKQGRFSYIYDYGTKIYLYCKVTDSIMNGFLNIPYLINADTIQVYGNMTSLYNSKPSLLKLDYTHPNPVAGTFFVPFAVMDSGYCTADIINLQGKRVIPLVSGTLKGGQHEICVMNYLEKSGIYFIFIKFGDKAYSYSAFYYDKK